MHVRLCFVCVAVRHRAARGLRGEHRRPGGVHGAAGDGRGQGPLQAGGEVKSNIPFASLLSMCVNWVVVVLTLL